MKNIGKQIFIGLLGGVIIATIFLLSTPYLWKLSGKSFIYGKEFIYKGKSIAEFNKDCIISHTNELERVEAICPDKKFLFIFGVPQDTNKQNTFETMLSDLNLTRDTSGKIISK